MADQAIELTKDDLGLWMGSTASAYEYRRLLDKIQSQDVTAFTRMGDTPDAPDTGEEVEQYDILLSMAGSVAVIDVQGILVDTECCSWYNWGLVGYPDLRRAAMKAVANKATDIVFHMKTPGGMVQGLGAFSEFVKELNKQIPCSFYCDSHCSSAGMWIGSTLGPMVVGAYAEIGNIGVMRMLADQTKMYSEYGIEFQILKSTDLKGAGDPRIKLSSDQKDYLQQEIDTWADLFVQHLATSLKLPEERVKTQLATAESWVGMAAVNIGLASKVISFDKYIASKANKVKNTTSSTTPSNSFTRFAMALPVLEGDLAADDSMVEALTIEAEGSESPEDETTTPPETTPATEIGLEALTTKLVGLAAENAELKLKMATAEAEKENLTQQISAVKPVLVEVVQGFSIKLGRPASSVEGLDVATLVTMVADLRTEFKRAIPVGQKSTQSTANETTDNEIDTLTAELTSRSVAASIPRKRK